MLFAMYFIPHLLLLRSCLLLRLRIFLRRPLRQTPGDELVPLYQSDETAFREPPSMDTTIGHTNIDFVHVGRRSYLACSVQGSSSGTQFLRPPSQ